MDRARIPKHVSICPIGRRLTGRPKKKMVGDRNSALGLILDLKEVMMKAHDSFMREVLYSILMKLVRLIKMCVKRKWQKDLCS
jgi:hypothetical protein